jgi:hypothetical protein
VTLLRVAVTGVAALAGAALLAVGAFLWIGTAQLRAVHGALEAVLPDGWEKLAAERAGRPDLLESDLRAAMGVTGLRQADEAGIAVRQAYGTLYAVVPHGFESMHFDLMAGCWVNLQMVAVVRGPRGGWGLGRQHCVADRPPSPLQEIG